MTLPKNVRNAWHLAALTSEVAAGDIKTVMVVGQPVVLFRTAAGLGSLIDRCPHRNFPLSKGRIVGNSIECAYHGWQFERSGNCTQVPGCTLSADEGERFAAQSVRIVERHGAIFVNLSSEGGSEPNLPPNIGDPNLDHFWWQQGTWKGRAYDAIENVMDPFHTNHLHHGFIRRRDHRLPVNLLVRSHGNGIEMEIVQQQPDLGLMSRFLERDRSRSISRYYPPTAVQATWFGEKKLTLCVTAFFTPSTDGSFMPFACFTTPKGLAPGWLKQAAIRLFLRPVVAQDKRALAEQYEVMEAFGSPKFLSGPGDLLGNRLFRLWSGETLETQSDPPVPAML